MQNKFKTILFFYFFYKSKIIQYLFLGFSLSQQVIGVFGGTVDADIESLQS